MGSTQSTWGLQLKHLSCREVIHLISMKQFVVLFCLVPFALCEADAEADPGYGHGRYGGHYQRKYYAPKCHTTYETVTSQACTTVSEPVCHTRTVTNFRTESKEECATRSVQECATVTRDVPEQQCATRSVQECRNIVTQVPDQECHTETEQQCTDVQQCTTEQQCTDTQQCTPVQQCTTETQNIPETTLVEECQDIIHQVCTETQVHVQAHANVIAHAAPAHAVLNALPTPVITHAAPAHAVFNALPATGVIAPGPFSAALGYNGLPVGAALHVGLIPTGPQVLPQRIVKREADAEADADADADADAQFFGLNAFPVGRLATGPASLPLAAAPV